MPPMHHNPKPDLPPTGSHRVEFLGRTSLVALWCYTLVYYDRLPATIPIHFNAMGQAGGFGRNPVLLGSPARTTVLFHRDDGTEPLPVPFQQPGGRRQEDVLMLYTDTPLMVPWLKLMVVPAFGLLTMHVADTVRGHGGLGPWLLPVTQVMVLLPLAYFLARTFHTPR